VAQDKARRLATRRGVELDFQLADLTGFRWPQAQFDVVAAIFIQFAGPELRARIFEGVRQALKPGGLLLLEGYRPEQIAYGTGGPSVAENLYTEPMLREAFAGMEIVVLSAYDAPIEEGAGHAGVSALIDLVARQPR
jgi:SAM-dependent methyltransferase